MAVVQEQANFDWLIIGGGIHGVHLGARLAEKLKRTSARIAILDPWPRLLHSWERCAKSTGMKYLRSPAVHNLGINPFGLQKFAGSRNRYRPNFFSQPYSRPSLSLFKKHCDGVIETFALDSMHIKERVEKIDLQASKVEIITESGNTLVTKKAVLALGMSENLSLPAWADASRKIEHIFSSDFKCPSRSDGSSLVVVGGGITAIQIAMHASEIGLKVHLIARHDIRPHRFDSDPGWLGPKYMRGFLRETCFNKRRHIINGARNRGSAPQEIISAFKNLLSSGKIHFHKGGVTRAKDLGSRVSIELNSGELIDSNRVILATGFTSIRPGGKLVDDLIFTQNLPTAPCGFPMTNFQLKWHPRLHVSGALAELELGPIARNIAGARAAAERIVDF